MSAPAPDRRREALLNQLGYLLAEVDALGPLLGGLPPDVLTAALPGERSPLATFAHLAALDRDVYAPQVAGAEPPPEPGSTPPDSLEAALTEVRTEREALIAAFEAVDPWSERLYKLAFAIAHRDAAELKRLAYRLHESHITTRTVDLPK